MVKNAFDRCHMLGKSSSRPGFEFRTCLLFDQEKGSQSVTTAAIVANLITWSWVWIALSTYKATVLTFDLPFKSIRHCGANQGEELKLLGAVVVAKLVQWSLLIPEVRGSNPFIGKLIWNICFLSTVLERRKEKKNGTFFKKQLMVFKNIMKLLQILTSQNAPDVSNGTWNMWVCTTLTYLPTSSE